MTERLKRLAGGRVVLALEGGYDLEAISAAAAACVHALLGDPAAARAPDRPSAAASRVLDAVAEAARPFWPKSFDSSSVHRSSASLKPP